MAIVRDEPLLTVFANKSGTISIQQIDRERGASEIVCVDVLDVDDLIRALQSVRQEIERENDA